MEPLSLIYDLPKFYFSKGTFGNQINGLAPGTFGLNCHCNTKRTKAIVQPHKFYHRQNECGWKWWERERERERVGITGTGERTIPIYKWKLIPLNCTEFSMNIYFHPRQPRLAVGCKYIPYFLISFTSPGCKCKSRYANTGPGLIGYIIKNIGYPGKFVGIRINE